MNARRRCDACAPRRGRPGLALLECLIATVILAIAGVSLVVQLREALGVLDRVRRDDAELRQADQFLSKVRLWSRVELDARLGEREQGPYRLRVTRSMPRLYRLSLVDSGRTRVLLETTVYRPVEDDHAR